MSAAVVIEVYGRQAGLIVRDKTGRFRFFSAITEAYPLEGQTFRSVEQASRAVKTAISERRAAWS